MAKISPSVSIGFSTGHHRALLQYIPYYLRGKSESPAPDYQIIFLYKYYLDFSILFGLFQHYFIYPSLLPWIHLQEKGREMDLW